MRMIRQTVLDFKIERTEEQLTAHGGLALLAEYNHGLGLRQLSNQVLPAPGSNRGYAPCAIRDHYEMMYDLIKGFGAKPADESAEQTLASIACHRGLIEYDRELERVTDPAWEREYLEPERQRGKEAGGASQPALSSASPSEPLLSLGGLEQERSLMWAFSRISA